MDYGISAILLEESKKKNKMATDGINKAKLSLLKLRVFSLFNSNVRMQKDVIKRVVDEANRSLKTLKLDRENLDYLGSVLSSYDFDDNFIDLITTIGIKDEELFKRFCKLFESTLFIRRGIRYMPNVPEDACENADKLIDDKMKLIRELNGKA